MKCNISFQAWACGCNNSEVALSRAASEPGAKQIPVRIPSEEPPGSANVLGTLSLLSFLLYGGTPAPGTCA